MIKYCSTTYACENREKESGYAYIYSVKAPPRLLKHSLAAPSAAANVMTRKYVDGLPLYRRLRRVERSAAAAGRICGGLGSGNAEGRRHCLFQGRDWI